MRLLAQDFFCLSSSDSTAVPPSMVSGRETEGGREGEGGKGQGAKGQGAKGGRGREREKAMES